MKEIDGYVFQIIFKDGGNELWCDTCQAEYSWAMYDEDPEHFINIHRVVHEKSMT